MRKAGGLKKETTRGEYSIIRDRSKEQKNWKYRRKRQCYFSGDRIRRAYMICNVSYSRFCAFLRSDWAALLKSDIMIISKSGERELVKYHIYCDDYKRTWLNAT